MNPDDSESFEPEKDHTESGTGGKNEMMPYSNNKPRLIEAPHSASLQSAFIAACLQLNSSIVAPFIGDDEIFEDMEKDAFIQSLDNLFSIRRGRVGEVFNASYRITTCNGCSEGKGRAVHHFEFYHGNLKVPFSDFAYLIREEDAVVIDIFRCYSYDSACVIDLNLYNWDKELLASERLNWEILDEEDLNDPFEDDAEDDEPEDDV